MSVRIEWMEADKVYTSSARKGTVMGDGDQITHDLALLFQMDEAVVIEGTEEQLRTILRRAWASLDDLTNRIKDQS